MLKRNMDDLFYRMICLIFKYVVKISSVIEVWLLSLSLDLSEPYMLVKITLDSTVVQRNPGKSAVSHNNHLISPI